MRPRPNRSPKRRWSRPILNSELKSLPPGAIAGAAATYAVAELGLGLLLGFAEWGRAEALAFFLLRPWLLLILAWRLARYEARGRVPAYALALLLAAACETLLVLGLGASDPWPEAARGLAGGVLVLAAAELVLRLVGGRIRRGGRHWALAMLALLFLTPFGLRPYEAIVVDDGHGAAARKPDLMLMTALPIIWGEGGAFDPESRPAASYGALRSEFSVRPLDYLDEATLGSGRLLLLAQPRALEPAELVALDAWVRRGGRALILTDPLLAWPSELPLLDVWWPPQVGLLGPLLTHWGLELEPPEARQTETTIFDTPRARRKLVMAAPGRFEARGQACTVAAHGLFARCRIGQGEAWLLADADLLRDSLWLAPGDGGRRHTRLADNPLVVADLLDGLAGIERPRIGGRVEWISPEADRRAALLLALLPLGLAAAAGLTLRLKRGR